MLRLALLVIWLLLSAWLLIWTGEGLFGRDQRSSVLPFTGETTHTAPVLIAVAWGILLAVGGVMLGPRPRRLRAGGGRVAVGRIVEIIPTGAPVNDVRSHDVFLRVEPKDGDDFIAQARAQAVATPLSELRIGHPLVVRYHPGDEDAVVLADPHDPAAEAALNEWRAARRPLDPLEGETGR
jgi:hypothetical protein